MLRELLRLVETAQGPISLTDLARQLGVDNAVLDSMLQHWVRKGRLVVEGSGYAGEQRSGGAGERRGAAGASFPPAPPLPCSPAGNCGSCSGMTNCPFVVRLPVTYRVNTIPLTSVAEPTSAD